MKSCRRVGAALSHDGRILKGGWIERVFYSKVLLV